jgi:hypothetical protein
MTLVDTNVLRDVLGADPEWLPWSVDQLRQCRLIGQLLIDDITYAELAVRVATEGALNAALAELGVRLERTPVPALFLRARPLVATAPPAARARASPTSSSARTRR